MDLFNPHLHIKDEPHDGFEEVWAQHLGGERRYWEQDPSHGQQKNRLQGNVPEVGGWNELSLPRGHHFSLLFSRHLFFLSFSFSISFFCCSKFRLLKTVDQSSLYLFLCKQIKLKALRERSINVEKIAGNFRFALT